jgi:hypothetical protein
MNMGVKSKKVNYKVRLQTVITYLCLGLDSWAITIAWQELDQGCLQEVGKWQVELKWRRLTVTFPALGSFWLLLHGHTRPVFSDR